MGLLDRLWAAVRAFFQITGEEKPAIGEPPERPAPPPRIIPPSGPAPPPPHPPEEPEIQPVETHYLQVQYQVRPRGSHKKDEYSDTAWVEHEYAGEEPTETELLAWFNDDPSIYSADVLPYEAFAFAIKAIRRI